MRLLADSSLHGRVVRALVAMGHDVDDVRRWPVDPGDAQILERARDDARILVTSDRDFGELAVRYQHAHAGVIVVAPDLRSDLQAELCQAALMTEEGALNAGTLVSISMRGIRVRPPSAR